MAKYRYTPLVGDPSPLPAQPLTDAHTRESAARTLANMKEGEYTQQEIFSLAITAGIPATALLGIAHCYEHYKMQELRSNTSVTPKFSYSTDVAYCNNCFTWFKDKRR